MRRLQKGDFQVKITAGVTAAVLAFAAVCAICGAWRLGIPVRTVENEF